MAEYIPNVFEETENYRFRLWIRLGPTKSLENSNKMLLHENIQYEITDDRNGNKILAFPYKITGIQKKTDGISDSNELDVEMGEFFKTRAHQASQIVDHETFKSSKAWYMLKPLSEDPVLRARYGVKMRMKYSLMNSLVEKIYFDGVTPHESLLGMLTQYVGYKITFCDERSCKTTHRASFNEKRVVLKPIFGSNHKATQLAATWGLEFEHSKRSD